MRVRDPEPKLLWLPPKSALKSANLLTESCLYLVVLALYICHNVYVIHVCDSRLGKIHTVGPPYLCVLPPQIQPTADQNYAVADVCCAVRPMVVVSVLNMCRQIQ